MKVLHLIDSAGLYGAEAMLLNLVEAQLKAGLSPMILSDGTAEDGAKPLEIEAKKRGLPCVPFRMKRGLTLLKGLEVMRFAKNNDYDILHSHGYKFDILLGFLPRFLRQVPVITTIHGFAPASIFSKIFFYQWLDRLAVRRIEQVILVDKSMLSQNNLTGIGFDKVSVINNGINVDREIKNMEIQRVWLPHDDIRRFVQSGAPLLGTICRLSIGKGVQDLIDAFAEVVKEYPNARLLVVGDGLYKSQLEIKIQNLGLTEKVMLAGYSNYPYYFLSKFDAFILPSHSEGLPMVLLEAMLSGSLILATNVGGMPQVLCGGELGYLVRPKDPVAMHKMIIELCDDELKHPMHKDRRKGLQNYVTDNYSSTRMQRLYSEQYNHCLADKIDV